MMMTEEEKDNRIKELEEFLEDVIEHPYMCGSSIWEEGRKLLNKEEGEQIRQTIQRFTPINFRLRS